MIHVNERYTRLTNYIVISKEYRKEIKSIFFGDNRDVLLRRELLKSWVQTNCSTDDVDCYVLSINEILIKMDTLNSIFSTVRRY